MPLSLSRRRSSLAVALAGVSAVAWAQPQPPQQPPPHQQQQPQPHARDRQQGLSESVRRAERNGQVLSAEQVQSDGRDVNRVKIIDDKGRVRVFWDDPAAKDARNRAWDEPRSQRPSKSGGDSGKGRKDKPRTRSDDDGDPTL
ncbi:hypothetical protein LF41_1719 [Lysobacter dokdonensis DS-58]|uniref:Uncharacterized protein n=1 Tax=Lysobacter dokdonensis DS-58 TaxID=1300345 RepID=A0A0A2WHX3_9GAMM|nr:hypothetical protein [Lysobacter dokdonensis]KGQ17865.1 hypothetical protein LF41_1719 [Lysobacter dokdonensis DS-58]